MAERYLNYLKECFRAFSEVREALYGRPFDLAAIEKTAAKFRAKKTLSYHDLKYFEARDQWWFERYWAFPPEHQMNLDTKRFDFWNLPKRNETVVIEDLLDAFKSIGLASIILRFIRPDEYGIISPPVERVLDVRQGQQRRPDLSALSPGSSGIA